MGFAIRYQFNKNGYADRRSVDKSKGQPNENPDKRGIRSSFWQRGELRAGRASHKARRGLKLRPRTSPVPPRGSSVGILGSGARVMRISMIWQKLSYIVAIRKA